MQSVPKKKLHDELARLELRCQPSQTSFIFVCWDTERELILEFLCQLLLEAKRGLVIDQLIAVNETQTLAQLVFGQALHSDEQPTLRILAAGPFFNVGVELFPAAEIEIADTEIGSV